MKPFYQDEFATIYLGDCREVLPSLDPECADFVLTDPPYGVEWQSNRRQVKHAVIENDADLDWLGEVFRCVYAAMRRDSLCVSFYGWPDAEMFLTAWKAAGFMPKSHIIWVKNMFGLGWFTRGQHEPAYLLAKGEPQKPLHAISDVIQADTTKNELHPTQKPVSLCLNIVEAFTTEGELVLDPFMGSGTTLVAAKRARRKAIGIELNRDYCEMAVYRLKRESGIATEMPKRRNIKDRETPLLDALLLSSAG